MAVSFALSIAGNRFDGFKANANDVVNFKLVRKESDVFDENNVFKPDMTHQIFGDSESIFGYKDLRINIYCTAGRMITYVNIVYSDKVTPQKCDGVSADNIMRLISEKLQPGFLTNLDEFLAALQRDSSFNPFGELIHSYVISKEGEKDRQFQIYFNDMSVPGYCDYHERLQPFLLFYVDAASYVDIDDDKWSYYTIYEKYQHDDSYRFAFVGYMTVYNYYAYPERVRPRISQVLIMPPFQRQGHGARLLQTFYNRCYTQPEILDITVEDPSESFQRVRDFVDSQNCTKLLSYQPKELLGGFNDNMEHEARYKLKLNRRQARRIYEILRLKATDCMNNKQFKEYRLDIKKRLNIPFEKNGRDFRKLQRALNPTELSATLNQFTKEQRMESLEKQFLECVNEYRLVLERLSLGS